METIERAVVITDADEVAEEIWAAEVNTLKARTTAVRIVPAEILEWMRCYEISCVFSSN